MPIGQIHDMKRNLESAGNPPADFVVKEKEGHGFGKKTNMDYFGAASMLFWEQHLLKE